MEYMSIWNGAIWLPIVQAIGFISCFYFALTYFQHVKTGETRLIRLTKIWAVISLAVALLAPVLYQLYMFMRFSNGN
ncbi:MAG: hypothetical protein ABS942_07855 [Solibacillus sp.]|mgnify:CR=1 FL=1|uniref:hypothetical protein n=1 Tax=unclassified Solibacillus TaxID=2637870 RepID=UPI00310151EC